MTIRRAKPIKRTALKRSTKPIPKRGKKAEREQPALDAFRAVVHGRRYCEVPRLVSSLAERERICGTTGTHPGDNAHHVWPEDHDSGLHDPERGLLLCWRAHRWTHDYAGFAKPGEPLRSGDHRLLRPHDGALPSPDE